MSMRPEFASAMAKTAAKTAVRLRQVSPGVYETPDGRYQIKRDRDLSTKDAKDLGTTFWSLSRRATNGDWESIYPETDTKAELVRHLEWVLAHDD